MARPAQVFMVQAMDVNLTVAFAEGSSEQHYAVRRWAPDTPPLYTVLGRSIAPVY